MTADGEQAPLVDATRSARAGAAARGRGVDGKRRRIEGRYSLSANLVATMSLKYYGSNALQRQRRCRDSCWARYGSSPITVGDRAMIAGVLW